MVNINGYFLREAWKNLGNMSKNAAMRNYIDELTRLNANWECHLENNSKIYIEEEVQYSIFESIDFVMVRVCG